MPPGTRDGLVGSGLADRTAREYIADRSRRPSRRYHDFGTMVPRCTTIAGRELRRGSARLRHRSWDPWPPSSGSSNAFSSGRRARLFRTKLQPIQLQRRVERAMESERVRDGDRNARPESLRDPPRRPTTWRRCGWRTRRSRPILPTPPSASRAAMATTSPTGRPSRSIGDSTVATGDVTVATSANSDAAIPSRIAARPRVWFTRRRRRGRSRRPRSGTLRTHRGLRRPGRRVAPSHACARSGQTARRQSFVVDGRPLTIGRGPDNGLVLEDSRASRHHARIYGRQGALLLADLGSTNGSWVNDRRIEEIALGEGDQIRIGDTILVVESVEEA